MRVRITVENATLTLAAVSAAAVAVLMISSAGAAQRRAYRLPTVDLKQQVVWGAACESPDGFAISFGGQDQKAEDGQPHTRVKEAGQWKAIHEELRANNPLQKHRDRCWALRQRQKDLVARARYIFFQGMTAAEEAGLVAEKLVPEQRRLREELADLVAHLAAADLKEYEAGQARFAARQLGNLPKNEVILTALSGGLTPEVIQAMCDQQMALERAAEALDAEPPPRALSPVVYDARTKLFVLFGGDHLDYLTNDTWVFDPARKKWMQRHPQNAPPPRAHHTLKAASDGKIVLTGGYQYTSSTDYCGAQYQDIGDGPWEYDVQADAWSGSGKPVPPDTRTYRTGPFHPDFFLKGSRPDAAATAQEIRSAPANTWFELKPPHRPELDRVWGTAVLDPDHDLVLVFNGGHSSHGGTDVLHYHLATNRWELPFPVEFPLGQLFTNTSYPAGSNFNRRPWVTGHTYQSYNYDAGAKRLFFTGEEWNCYVYDPVAADWTGRFPKPKGMIYNDAWYTLAVCATPRGLITWTQHGTLFQLDAAANRWVPLEVAGKKLPDSVVDSSTVVYDSKRDRLLFFQTGYGKEYKGQVYEYSLKTGVAAALSPKNQTALAALAVKEMDRGCYHPGADLVLLAHLLPAQGEDLRRTLAYDCAENCWVSLDIKYETEKGNRPSWPRGGGHSCGWVYDAKRKLVWGVNTLDRRVYVFRMENRGLNVKPL